VNLASRGETQMDLADGLISRTEKEAVGGGRRKDSNEITEPKK
jgi:hypothetical protein